MKRLGKCELCVKKSKGNARNSGPELIVIPLSKSVSFPTRLASLISAQHRRKSRVSSSRDHDCYLKVIEGENLDNREDPKRNIHESNLHMN